MKETWGLASRGVNQTMHQQPDRRVTIVNDREFLPYAFHYGRIGSVLPPRIKAIIQVESKINHDFDYNQKKRLLNLCVQAGNTPQQTQQALVSELCSWYGDYANTQLLPEMIGTMGWATILATTDTFVSMMGAGWKETLAAGGLAACITYLLTSVAISKTQHISPFDMESNPYFPTGLAQFYTHIAKMHTPFYRFVKKL